MAGEQRGGGLCVVEGGLGLCRHLSRQATHNYSPSSRGRAGQRIYGGECAATRRRGKGAQAASGSEGGMRGLICKVEAAS